MNTATGTAKSIAPWAEIVPDVGQATVDVLLTLPDDGYRYEVVDGVLVRVAGSGYEATTIGLTIAAELRAYARPRRLGVATPADGVYRFPGAETGLLPDVGFIAASKVPFIVDRRKPMPFAPDLAVEVASPDQDADAMEAKTRLYLGGGTRLVWLVWPRRRQVDVWRPDHRSGPVATLGLGDSLGGEDVVPGFSLSIDDVFADPLG
jgi:Uma2 family endonuclease